MWVGVNPRAGGEGASTGGESTSMEGEGTSVAGEGASDSITSANCTHCRSPLVGGTSPSSHSIASPSLPRPPSSPRIIQVHPPSAIMVSTKCAPPFHGLVNSPFLFNPVMAMQQMLPHSTRFIHNGNAVWLP